MKGRHLLYICMCTCMCIRLGSVCFSTHEPPNKILLALSVWAPLHTLAHADYILMWLSHIIFACIFSGRTLFAFVSTIYTFLYHTYFSVTVRTHCWSPGPSPTVQTKMCMLGSNMPGRGGSLNAFGIRLPAASPNMIWVWLRHCLGSFLHHVNLVRHFSSSGKNR
jgi:hypothetical protein